MEATRAPCKQENTLGTITKHVVTKELPANKERPMRAKSTAFVIQATFRDAMVGSPGLVEDAETALVTFKDHNGITRTENWPLAMLQGLFNETIDQN